jgi:hypothetical protein
MDLYDVGSAIFSELLINLLPSESVEEQRVIRMGKKYSQENANTTLYVEAHLYQTGFKFM